MGFLCGNLMVKSVIFGLKSSKITGTFLYKVVPRRYFDFAKTFKDKQALKEKNQNISSNSSNSSLSASSTKINKIKNMLHNATYKRIGTDNDRLPLMTTSQDANISRVELTDKWKTRVSRKSIVNISV